MTFIAWRFILNTWRIRNNSFKVYVCSWLVVFLVI